MLETFRSSVDLFLARTARKEFSLEKEQIIQLYQCI